MARRGWGEGNIIRRKDGRWQASLRLGDGKRKAWYGRTRHEVAAKLVAAVRDRQRGVPMTGGSQTLSAFLAYWLENVAKPSLRPRTLVRYKSLAELHILPVLGRRSLPRLGPQDLQQLYAAKLATLAPRTVGHIHRLLHRALADALRWGLVARNVCELVTPPRVTAQEIRTLDAAQCRTFLAAAQGDPLEALYVLALTTGMREGELLGLKWGDVDLQGGRLQVRRTIARVSRQGWVELPPKTQKGQRALDLPPVALEALRQHRQRQLGARLQAGPLWDERGLVFCNSLGRPIEVTNLLQRNLYPRLAKVGLPRVRFHDLRHSAASLLLSLGVHPKIVQEILGHAQIGITMDTYSHTIPGQGRDALAALDGLLRANGCQDGCQ